MNFIEHLFQVLNNVLPSRVSYGTNTIDVDEVEVYPFIVYQEISDRVQTYADDKPQIDKQELRITLYTQSNYIHLKNQIIARLISNYFYITERRYGGYDTDTGYHQYTIDVAKTYEIEQEED